VELSNNAVIGLFIFGAALLLVWVFKGIAVGSWRLMLAGGENLVRIGRRPGTDRAPTSQRAARLVE
jgi:hypothetical protein